MGPFSKDNHEELVNQIKEHLAKMPEEQRKHLAQIALKIIGTNDPEKLKQLLQTQSSQLDLNKILTRPSISFLRRTSNEKLYLYYCYISSFCLSKSFKKRKAQK